ncbi:MAG: hypothetical protein M3N12_03900, partial [Verrucomicrobiota bacterium]|nr:hypothetical protein [Verrucomicrobiota bacterium]
LRPVPPIEPFAQPPRGMILSEGAGAVLLTRSGAFQIDKIAAGTNFRKQSEAGDSVRKVFSELCRDGETDLVMASANGTFVDEAERGAIAQACPNAKVYSLKGALGESVGASSLWQTIAATQALRTQRVPNSRLRLAEPNREAKLRRAVVSVCGLNQQVAGLQVTLGDSVA